MTGAKNHRELIVWQVADELRMEVYQLTARSPASRDFKFCDQLRDAVSGIPSNIAEGFRRKSSTDYARFITYAFSGMDETEERLADGVKRGHWAKDELTMANRLLRRLTKGLRNFQAYLLSEEGIERWRILYEARHQRRDRRNPPNPSNPPNPPNLLSSRLARLRRRIPHIRDAERRAA